MIHKVDRLLLFFVAVAILVVGGFIGWLVTMNDIEKSCLYGDRLIFSQDKVFDCHYMEGVKQK